MESRKKEKKQYLIYFGCYTVVFAVFALLAFQTFIRFNRTLLWAQDGISQYYPRAVYFSKYMKELFAGIFSGNFELPMYDFSIGMGAEIIYSFEPLYFLFALFPEEKIELAYNIITILRFYVAGISFSAMCFYFKKEPFSVLIGSMVYVFCSFALYGGARHTMFMVPMILLPLLVVAMEELLFRKKWHLFTVLVTISLFSNYYYLYMSTLGLGVYFLVRYFCQKEKKSFWDFMKKGLLICGSYLLGVAMASIILVCNFGQYVGSGRSGSAIIKTPSLWYYSKEWLLRCFMSFLTTANAPGEWLKLGFLPIAFLAMILLFLRKGRRELKLLSVISVIMMAIPLFGFIFSGFSFVQNRWCYMAALLTAYITVEMMPEMKKLKIWEMAVMAGFTAAYGILSFWGPVLSTKYTKIASGCLLLTFLFLIFCRYAPRFINDYMKKGAALLLTAALILVNGHTFFSMSGAVKEYSAPGEAQKKAVETPLTVLDDLEDDSFYRAVPTETKFSALSSSMLLDYNGIAVFFSTINKSIMEYLSEMGCTDFGTTVIYGMDNRTWMNALASVKYCGTFKETKRSIPYGYEKVLQTEKNGKQIELYRNMYELPLGYTYTDCISEEELDKLDAVQKQEALMQRVFLESEEQKYETEAKTELQLTSEEVDIISVQENGVSLNDDSMTGSGEEERTITLHFEGKANVETYLVLKHAILEGDGSEDPIHLTIKTEGNSFRYKFRADDDRYKTGQKDFVFNLGYHKDPITSCKIEMSRAGTIMFESMKLYSQPMDHTEVYTQKLTEDILEHVNIGTNRITGDISVEQEKILVLSIPYQKGWTAYIDGEKTELMRANYMYMALPLEAGEHTVELEYEISGIRVAFAVMPSAAILFLGLCLIEWKRNRKRENNL